MGAGWPCLCEELEAVTHTRNVLKRRVESPGLTPFETKALEELGRKFTELTERTRMIMIFLSVR